jgi:hypothetical protein
MERRHDNGADDDRGPVEPNAAGGRCPRRMPGTSVKRGEEYRRVQPYKAVTLTATVLAPSRTLGLVSIPSRS